MPASWMTIWFEPCLRISGSETPSLSIRFRMMSIERLRSSEVSLCPFGGTRLQDDLEAALEVEAERRLPVDGRARDGEEATPTRAARMQPTRMRCLRRSFTD